MQSAQGVRAAGPAARRLRQPQEAGAQVGAGGRRGGRGRYAFGVGAHLETELSVALPFRIKQHGGCRPCHSARPAPVCGSDGHTYSSAVSAGMGGLWRCSPP